MKKIIYIFLFFMVFSCNNINKKQQKIIQDTNKEISFNIGYNTARINIGIFKKEDKYCFFFFKHLYTNYINIFNKNGNKIDSVDIKAFNVPNNEIINVSFLNSDTILLRSRKKILYIINAKSDLLKTIDLNNNTIFGIDSTYEIYNQMYNFGNQEGLLITNYNDKDNPYRNDTDYCKYLKYFIKKSFASKRFLFINNIYNDSILTKHTLKNFEYNYIEKNHFSMINPIIIINKPNIFIYSIYSNKVFIYSNESDSIISNFTVESIYSNQIFTKPFKINGECMNKLKKNAYTGENGSILDMYYSNYTTNYYFFIRIPLNEAPEKDLRYSIVGYDSDFKKIGETRLFKTPKTGILWTNKGVYISNEKLNYKHKKLKYRYYEFTK